MNHKEQKAIDDQNVISKIREIVDNDKETTLELLDSDYDYINFSTRANGNVGTGRFSERDYSEAERMENIINSQFRGKVSTDIETVDEWVHLNIEIV